MLPSILTGDKAKKDDVNTNATLIGSPPSQPEQIFNEKIFNVPPTFNALPNWQFDRLISTTPDVQNRQYFDADGIGTAISNFEHGKEGQCLYIIGDGLSSILNNTNIKTFTGTTLILSANKCFLFVFHNNVWYQVGV